MKPIFNSLGSNYSLSFALKALTFLVHPSKNTNKRLEKLLEEKFDGKAYLYYKGRDAIECCLRALGVGERDEILIQAFTCYAIEEAVLRASAVPIFVDLEKNMLNPSIKTLNEAYVKAKQPKAVLIQHTLGCPAEIKKIKQWCKQRNLFLIEDLAQAYGGKTPEGKLLGAYGDAVILSFGRDKILDAVSGGALIIRTPHKAVQATGKLPWTHVAKDMVYPLTTLLIRTWFSSGLGKILHKILVKTKIIDSPVKSFSKKPLSLPSPYAALVLYRLKSLSTQLAHRKEIASLYTENLKTVNLQEKVLCGSCLRFPVFVNNPETVVSKAKERKIYISDRWYRKAVDCGNLNCRSYYAQGNCPNAEKASHQILNLPTHQGITKQDAERLVAFLKSAI